MVLTHRHKDTLDSGTQDDGSLVGSFSTTMGYNAAFEFASFIIEWLKKRVCLSVYAASIQDKILSFLEFDSMEFPFLGLHSVG